MPEQSLPTGAVFLSYASQDAEAAARICEALRAAGVEVWLDKSELRGGDAWDPQIKKHIHDCAIFIPVISAHTNARAEGYFRGEWYLATRRLINMAHDAAFLVPVVIDETREADARVPEEFLRAQWSWLPGGETPPAFAQRVRQLLGADNATGDTSQSAAITETEPGVRAGYAPNRRPPPVRLVVPALIALLVLGAGAFWFFQGARDAPAAKPTPATASPNAAAAPHEKSIAVLPFADMSAEKDQEYMSDGIAEELLNLLAQVPDLKVIARTSSFAFKGEKVDVAEIAKKLNVAYVLEGSVRTSGNKLRITAQLVRAADSTHLWSEKYDRPLDDIFAVQDDIATAVVSELKIRLLGRAPKAKEKELNAYTLFLQARDIGQQSTPSAYEQAIALYQQALQLDPDYAEAWEGLARIYGYQAWLGVRPSSAAFPQALEAAERALALDPQYAPAHARLGWITVIYERDLGKAARHLSHALALDSSNTDIIGIAAVLLRRLGRMDQAIEFGKYVVDHDPVNADAQLDLGLAHKYARHWDAAITQYRTVLALSPSALSVRAFIGEVLVLQGNAKAALEEIRSESDDGFRLEVKSLAHHALGHSAESEVAFAELTEKYGDGYPSYAAEVEAYRRDTNGAFIWLDKAAQARDPSFGAIPFSAFCDSLRKDPRWLPFLRKHGMAPEQLAAIKFEVTLPQ